MVRKFLLALATILFCVGIAEAQKVPAESDYYPLNYAGDAWMGEVTEANDSTRELILTYRKGEKVQTFTGVLPSTYKIKMKDGAERSFPVTDLIGQHIKVYYMTKEKKVDGRKVKFNEIIRIKFILPKDKK